MTRMRATRASRLLAAGARAALPALAAGVWALAPAAARTAAAQPAQAVADAAQPAPAIGLQASALPTLAELDRLARDSRRRWERSPHGPMLARILPEWLTPSQLPEPQSPGARLTALYCVQCHHLPNPAMHDAQRWDRVVQRMLPRMQGQGNMGRLMSEMMVGPGAGADADAARPLAAPTTAEAQAIVAYLQRHAMPVAGPALAAALDTPEGRMFERACAQCHALPDPRRHSADAWPTVVRRMESNMQWMNRVVGSRPDPREPQLEPATIVRFLQRHARP